MKRSEVRIPTATYRLQLNRRFPFAEATQLVDYLVALGVSDCYLSPITRARPGSLHGYDVVEHGCLNPELGTEEEFLALSQRLREAGLGLVLDVVPNHMCIVPGLNRWWDNVLENGPSSPFAPYFDIDWAPPKEDLADQILLPILGDQFGRVLERQELRVSYRDGAFFVEYYDHVLPTDPGSWGTLLHPVLTQLQESLGENDAAVLATESIITALTHLPPRGVTDPDEVRERLREKEVIKGRVAALMETVVPVRVAVEQFLETLHGRPGDPRSFDLLEQLLGQQAYRLSHWRVAADEINYRRFFDVNELAAIRVEVPEVFEEVHQLAFRLIAEGHVTGLRIDHVDGLFDPLDYLGRIPPGCWVVVEKILERQERLRRDWPVHGTTGYDFLNLVNGVLVDTAAAEALQSQYTRFTGSPMPFGVLLYVCKRVVLRVMMSSELTVLARRLDRISEQHRYSRDFTLSSLQEALAAIVASFPVYRTYIRACDGGVGAEDEEIIRSAVYAAKRHSPAVSGLIFDFIGSLLLLEDPPELSEEERVLRRDFVMRFQQLTAPVMAKGMEDTAFYRAHPLVSLNEVGGDPAVFGVSVERFHRACEERQEMWPGGLSTTSTHDTKRGEDVRARINVISEVPERWEEAVLRWRVMLRPFKVILDGSEAPTATDEYLFYQTLLGTWPLEPMDDARADEYLVRIQDYLRKALREAKLRTSWIHPNEEYEEAALTFARAALARRSDNEFLEDLVTFVQSLVRPGLLGALAQVLLKLVAPGVPDLYQGTELWTFPLVDPDNRRPVDFARRRELLGAVQREAAEDASGLAVRLLRHLADGRLKLYLTWRGLHLRSAHPELFSRGAYVPLSVTGPRERQVIACARALDDRVVVAATARFFTTLPDPPVGRAAWGDATLRLPEGLGTRFKDVLRDVEVAGHPDSRGVALPLREVFASLPFALLERIA